MRTALGPHRPGRLGRLGRLVVLVVLVGSTTLGSGCAAPVEDGGGAASDSQEEAMPDQERLKPDDGGAEQQLAPYVDRLTRAVQDSGRFSGTELRPGQRRLVVYGVGRPSDDVQAVIEQAPGDLEVVWREAPYTRQELVAESQRIMREFPALHTGGPRPDGSGLQFTTSDHELLHHHDPAEALGTSYPTSVTEGPRPTPVAEPTTTG